MGSLELAGDAGAERPSFDRFRRRSAETFLGLVVSTVGNSLYYLVVARTLGPAGTGVVSVSIVLATVLALVIFALLNLANTFFGARDAAMRPPLLANSLLVSATVGSVLAAVVLAGLEATGVTFGARWYELAIALAGVPFSAAARLVAALVLASGRSLAYNVLTVLAPALSFAAVGILFLAFGSGVRLALVSVTASQVVVLAATLAASGIALAAPSRAVLRASLRYSLQGYPGTLLQLFNLRFDLFLVSSIRGSAAAGIYSVAVLLAELVWKISSAAATVLFPRVAAAVEAPVAFTLRTARVVLLVMVVALAGLVLVAWWPVLPLLGDGFTAALRPLLFLAPGILALGLSNIVVSDLAGRGAPRYASYASLVGLAVTVSLTPLLIWLYGPSGAAAGSSVSYALSTVFVTVVFVRRLGVRPRDLVLVRRDDLPALRRTRLVTGDARTRATGD